jgi:hypothetical protein
MVGCLRCCGNLIPSFSLQFESNSRIAAQTNYSLLSHREATWEGFHDRLHRKDVSNLRFEGLGYLGFDAGFPRGDGEKR